MCTERGGFEPPDAFASTVFKTVSFGHSDISLFILTPRIYTFFFTVYDFDFLYVYREVF